MTKKYFLNDKNGVAMVAVDGKIYAYVNGKYYSPINFRPIDGDGRQLRADSQNTIRELLPDAIKMVNDIEADENLPTLQPAIPASAPATPSALEIAVAETLASVSAEKVAEQAKAAFSEWYRAEYGIVPTVHKLEVPTLPPYETGEILHKDFDNMVKFLLCGINIYLYGPAGTGKSYIAKQISKVLNVPYYETNAVTDETQLKGFVNARGEYQKTPLYNAMKTGGVFLLDELDASDPNTLTIINNLLANREYTFPNDETVTAPDNFYVIATANTIGRGADMEYTGRLQLDAASLNRFAKFAVDYDRQIELAKAGGDDELVNFSECFRKSAKTAGVCGVLCTYRDIDIMCKASHFTSRENAMMASILCGMSVDDKSTIFGTMATQIDTENLWFKAFKNTLEKE